MLRQLSLLCLLLAIVGSGAALTGAAPAVQDEATAGEYMIGYAPGVPEAERAALYAASGGRIVRSLPAITADLVEFPTASIASGSPAEATMVSALTASAQVSYVEPNYVYTLTAAFTPNDTRVAEQYGWAQVDAYDAWGVTRGKSGVLIAVVDSGAQLDHADLQAKLITGKDFVDGDLVPSDGIGHGTHVAGTTGAATNNGVGVAGACPECRVLPVRVIGADGTGRASDIAAGIMYAADQGAKVINLSLGGPGSTTLKSAVDYAWSKGAFLTCAAGNAGTSSISQAYPAAYDACFAVAATTSGDVRASYSNYGSWVEVAAPGDRILSTYTNGGYSLLSGTSMAAPHVAGLAGLLASQGYSNTAIRNQICGTADAISGTGTSWSCGRVNFARALGSGAPAALPIRAYIPMIKK